MIVQHNITAMNANRMLGLTTGSLSKSTEKLSSGYRINRAADDAAGLTISEKMRKQIRGLDQASTNAEDGVSAVQTAEGALTEVHSMLQRMNELATQASNGTNSESDRQAIQDEISQLTTEIDRVSETTKFNETYLLKGDGTKGTKTVNAHDAGLAGKLADNGNGTSTFKLDKALAVGDKVTIAGKEYTIGKSKDTADYIDKATVTAKTAGSVPKAVGDSITSNGVTTSIVSDITATVADAATWADGDVIVDKDGTEWTMNSSATSTTADVAKKAGSGTLKTNTEMKALLKEGAVIKKNTALKINSATGSLQGDAKVVNELGKNEVSATDTTSVDALATSAKAGDSITVSGVTKEITAEKPASFADIKKAVNALAADTVAKINFTDYKISDTTDEAAGTISGDDFLALIKEGDSVMITGADIGGQGTTITAIGVSATEDDSITVDEAYKKMTEELTKASSIGTDTAAKVKSNGDGSFRITQGSVEIKNGLSFSLHVGADADMTNKINVDIDTMSSAGLGIKGISVAGEDGSSATYAIDAIADAISKVSSQRSALGAVQNRLEHTIANLDNVVENTTSAESRIRDTDMAEEMVTYSKNSILQQAGQSMLAQANQANQGVLSLLQ